MKIELTLSEVHTIKFALKIHKARYVIMIKICRKKNDLKGVQELFERIEEIDDLLEKIDNGVYHNNNFQDN